MLKVRYQLTKGGKWHERELKGTEIHVNGQPSTEPKGSMVFSVWSNDRGFQGRVVAPNGFHAIEIKPVEKA